METARDNPLSRFTGFWWTLGIFLLAALGVGIFAFLNRKDPENLEDAVAKTRYDIRKKVEEAEAASLKPGTIEEGMKRIEEIIASDKPAPVEKPEQVVPGSARAKALEATAPAPASEPPPAQP